jgi:hypothetical protein
MLEEKAENKVDKVEEKESFTQAFVAEVQPLLMY